ncbi:hypothetical protein [Halogeometricum sp. CBA1124]|uniref:hypothetical protein n=1 Tax=Halogeometricum sp. CBA1124 TaxID=2668071 RepID=UPI0017498C91|nr:hypothetical protein [Halogeometricum sp. CBA1124]
MSTLDLSIDDTLNLVTLSDIEWNADGSRIGFLRFADGETTFAAQGVGDVASTNVSLRDGTFAPETHVDRPVSAFAWQPNEPDQASSSRKATSTSWTPPAGR